jgi:DNA-binding transcriptional ArsR family regulator
MQALAHPLRMRILAALRDRALTARQLAAELDVERRQLSYHLRKMVGLGLLSAAPPAIGSPEERYQLLALPHFTDEAWEAAPAVAKHAYVTALVNQIHATSLAVVPFGGFDARNTHLTRTRLTVDKATWDALASELAATLQRVRALQAEGARRVAEDGAEAFHATAVMMLFATPVTGGEHDVATAEPDPEFTEDEAHERVLDLHEALGRMLATDRDWDRAVNVVDQLRVVLAAASALEKSGRRPLADERPS